MRSRFTKTGRPPGILQEETMESIAKQEEKALRKWASEQFFIRMKFSVQFL